MNVIDLFAGCGGLTDGFIQTQRFTTLATVDWEFATVQTLKTRLKNKWKYDVGEGNKSKVLHFDIQRTSELIHGYSDSKYGHSIGLENLVCGKPIDLIVGGPPCQAYSIAGRVRDTNGMQDDYRNYLFESYVEVVAHFKPRAFVFENVEGILSATPGGVSIIDRVRSAFAQIGYEIASDLKNNALFDVSLYGVPQKRRRVIIFGVQKNTNSTKMIEHFYSLMKTKATTHPLNAKGAFENLPKIVPYQGETEHSHKVLFENTIIPKNHEPRIHNQRDVEIFRMLTDDIKSGRNQYVSSKALLKLYKDKTGKSSNFHKYHVIRNDKPSNTIPAHLHKDGLRHIHPDPEQARTITVREAARLQSFDDDFEFIGTKGDQYKMVGNAVPPKFAQVIAETIFDLFSHREPNTVSLVNSPVIIEEVY